jgi:hypothetical protein
LSRQPAVVVGVAGVLFALTVLGGCGGGGQAPTSPPAQGSAIRGSVQTQGAAAAYDVLLDGQPVPGAMKEDGTFVIPGVPPGEHRVAVVEAGGMAGAYVSVVVATDEDTEVPPMVPELGGQIAGIVTVRDEGGLRSMAGVEVAAQPAYDILAGRSSAAEPSPSPLSDLPSFSAFTDDDGSYLIRAVPQGEYVVTVAAPGYGENYQWIWVGAGRTAVADFELRPAIDEGVGTVTGRVMAQTEGALRPLEGALVSIFTDSPWFPPEPLFPGVEPADQEGDEGAGQGESEEGGGGVSPPWPGPPDEVPAPWFDGVSTLTDAQGNYSLNAPAGYASIEVFAPGYEPAWEQITVQPDQVLELSFTLRPMPEDWPPPPGPGPVPLPEPVLEPG